MVKDDSNNAILARFGLIKDARSGSQNNSSRAKSGSYMHQVYTERMLGNPGSFKKTYLEAQNYIVDNPGALLFSNSLIAYLHDDVISNSVLNCVVSHKCVFASGYSPEA